MGSKASAPAAPDYTSAANATAAGNQQNAIANTFANRVNQVTPYGNLTYSSTPNDSAYQSALQAWQQGGQQGPTPDPNAYLSWTGTQTLSPQQQGILDSTNSLNQGLLNTANSGLNYANSVLSQPGVNTSNLPSVGINPGQTYYQAEMTQLQPQIDRQNQMLDAQLANQGVTPGSDAYNNAKQVQSQNINNLLAQTTTQGFNTGLAANQNAFNQQAYNQMQPINVINALRTGTQVQNPNLTNVPQQQYTPGSDLLGAANSQYQSQLNAYNAQQAQSGNFMSGLMGLGGAALSSPWLMSSDRRLKSEIKRIGTHDELGIGIYSYIKNGRPEVGVMADEVFHVKPEAVVILDDGYMMVNYGVL
jgi:hypothetical protein